MSCWSPRVKIVKVFNSGFSFLLKCKNVCCLLFTQVWPIWGGQKRQIWHNYAFSSWFSLFCNFFFLWQLASENTVLFPLENIPGSDSNYFLVHLNFLLFSTTPVSVLNAGCDLSGESSWKLILTTEQSSWAGICSFIFKITALLTAANIIPAWLMSCSQKHVQVVRCVPCEEVTSCLALITPQNVM